MKSPWYTGMLIKTSSKLRITCMINWSNTLNSKSRTIFLISPIKLKRFSNANVAIMVSMIVGLPNSMTSCLYLFNTSSAPTLVVSANVVSERPNCLLMVSMNPKNNEVVLWITHIRCQFHQALRVFPQLKASTMLPTFLATKT